MYTVRGKFANGHTFSLSPVDAAGPHEAVAKVTQSDEVKAYESPVVMVTAKVLTGKGRKIRISENPAAERKGGGGGGRKKAATKQAPAQSGRR